MRRNQACRASIFLALSASICPAAVTGSQQKPNVVVIFIDDLGYGDIGPFGSTINKTPNLDRMAAEGMRFTDFYVSSTACTPSRAALMTGCYADRVGMDGRVNFPAGERGLNPSEITIAEILKAAGYVTGCFGKWHLGDQPEFLPQEQGFDEYLGIPYSNDMWPQSKRKEPPLPLVRGATAMAEIRDGDDQALLCKVCTEGAVDFIRRHADGPFFVYLPHAFIHSPRFSREPFLTRAKGDPTRAQIEEVDWSVGKVLETLRDLKLGERTLVFFLSDNGGAGGTSMGPLRGGKGGPKYEGHMRTPTLAWWPGQIPPGSVCHEIAATIDLLPTIAKLAGREPPTDRVIDGHDITPLLLARPKAKSPHRMLYYEIDGVRDGKWKLVRVGGNWALYDLEADLGETNDLADQHPDQVARLSAALEKHAEELEKHRRPAAFVDNPKPLLPRVSADAPKLSEHPEFR